MITDGQYLNKTDTQFLCIYRKLPFSHSKSSPLLMHRDVNGHISQIGDKGDSDDEVNLRYLLRCIRAVATICGESHEQITGFMPENTPQLRCNRAEYSDDKGRFRI